MGFGRQFHALPGPSMPPVATTTQYTLSVLTSSMPGGTVGTPYSATLLAGGGVPPYVWTLIGGSLPPGLTLDSAGNITGTPTLQGTYGFDVQVTDPIGNRAVVSIGVSV